MSPSSIFGVMPGAKKEKHYANSRARRGSVVVSQAGSKKSRKDTDTESVSSEASTVIPPPPPPPKAQCPLRPYMEVMFEPVDGGDEKKSLCPLRRVKLSHTIPLCMFVMINMCLVIGTLLVTGVCRLASTFWDWGRKPPREVNQAGYKHTVYSPDFTAFTFLGTALFAFFVTVCYGPEWMSRALQIITTVGFFVGFSMTLRAKKEAPRAGVTPPGTPTTPTPTEA